MAWTQRIVLGAKEQIDDELIETLVWEAATRQRGAVERLRLQRFGAPARVALVALGASANLGEQCLDLRVRRELLRLRLEQQVSAHTSAGEIPHPFRVLGAVGMGVEVARAVISRFFQQLHQEELCLDRLRPEAQVL